MLGGDIICVCETWAYYENLALPPFLNEYKVIASCLAIKEKSVGRASGGIVIMAKEEMVFTTTEIEKSEYWIFLKVKTKVENYILGALYLKPNLNNDVILNMLNDTLTSILDTHQHHKFVLMGDFNAKIGQLNQAPEDTFFFNNVHETRASLHDVVDNRGNKLVNYMESLNLYVLNGRTAGDVPGNVTFLNTNGKSTIDLFWANLELLDNIKKFEIIETLAASDHFMCVLHIKEIHSSVSTKNNASELTTGNYLIKFKYSDSNKPHYQSSLQVSNRIYYNSNNVNELNNNLTCAIKEAASTSGMLKICKIHRKNLQINRESRPWYNDACKKAKHDLKLSQITLQKKRCTPNYNYFLDAKKQYKKVLQKCKNEYHSEITNALSNVKNNQEFWQTIKKLKYNFHPVNEITISEWETFYKQQFKVNNNLRQEEYFDCLHPFLDSNISVEELQTSLDKCKGNKSPGSDNLSNEFYKNLTPNWKHYLLNMYNKILNTETIPETWSTIQMSLLYKKGNKKDPYNYRGIALIVTICKIFTQILYNRLQPWLEEARLLNEFQMGFRKGRGTTDNIFTLMGIIHLNLRLHRRKIYAIFIDFKRAFDSVKHSILWKKLFQAGISAKIIRILQKLYANASLQVKLKETLSNLIKITEGVLQGEILSPLLFSIFIDDLESFFREEGLTGLNIDGFVDILLLAYADDLVILCDSQVDVQRKLNALERYCNKNFLQVNVEKTKVMVFHKGRKGTIRLFKYGNQHIETVNKFCYLGVIFTSSGKFVEAANASVKKSLIATHNVKSILRKGRSNSWLEKVKLLDTVVNATVLYGTEIWGLRYANTIERCQIRYIKNILHSPLCTPDYMLRLDSGIDHILTKIWRRALGWWYKLLKLDSKRYPKIVYNRLFALDSTPNNKSEFNWCTQLKEFLSEQGCLNFWQEQNINKNNIFNITNNYIQLMRQKDLDTCKNSSYNLHYKMLKSDFGMENYLKIKLPLIKQQIISQTRFASKRKFKIYYKNIKYEFNPETLCTICNTQRPDSLFHFFVECPILNPVRNNYLLKYTTNLNESNFHKILLDLHKNKINDLFHYTISAVKLRSFCMNE